MKKLLSFAMACALVLCGCGGTTTTEEPTAPTNGKSEGVMTYEEYVAAEMQTEVTIETYVQAKQSWWDNKGTFYTQDEDGAYFIYEMGCSQEDYDQLVPGTKIKVTGIKSEWSGEVEVTEATFEIEDGNFVATPLDVTAMVGTDDLAKHQNELVKFTDATVEKVEYKNGEPGDDIYVTATVNGTAVDFCVEYYLTGSDTEVYTTVGTLNAGDVVDIEGFLYWYNGANPHITAVTVK